MLDTLVQLVFISCSQSQPPLNPNEGDTYITGSNATDSWGEKQGMIATYKDGAWVYLEPKEGYIAYIEDKQTVVVFPAVNGYRIQFQTSSLLKGWRLTEP